MNKSVISIITKQYFEGVLYYSGWFFLVACLPIIFSSIWVALGFGVGGLMILTTRYQLSVDLENKTVSDYLWLFGIKTNLEKFRYQKMHYVLITKIHYKQQLNHQSISSSISGTLYKAFLVCDEQKHFLGESQNFSKLQSKMSSICFKLNTRINYPD